MKRNPKKSREKNQEIILLEQQREKQKNTGVNISRRNFLKEASLGTILAVTAPGMLVNIINNVFDTNNKLSNGVAYAGEFIENTQDPPGFKNCRDKGLLLAWELLQDPDGFYFGFNSGIRNKSFVYRMLRKLDRVKETSPFIEPAYWFLAAKLNITSGFEYNNVKNLMKINKPLTWFSSGINQYFDKWIRQTNLYVNPDIEGMFLNSIFTAAGRNENDVIKYRNLSLNQRENYLKDIMKTFKGLKFDEKKDQINDNYDKLLTAAWSSYFLTNHYYCIGKMGENTKNIYQNIELPLRKIKKEFKIRPAHGGPYYNNY